MQVDEEESSEESEEEVRIHTPHVLDPHRSRAGGGILHARLPGAPRSAQANSGVFSAQVGFPLPIGGHQQGAYCVFCVFVTPCRAQKRVAQQRLDSKIPLGRIIDIRKKVFAEVKVRPWPHVY